MTERSIVQRRTWSPLASLGVVWGSMGLASVLVAVVLHGPMPSVLDGLISRPMLMLACLLVVAYVVAYRGKVRIDQVWYELMSVFPLAVMGAVCFAVFGIWNDGSGASAIPLHQAMIFLVSGGIFPTTLGPDIFLRGTLACLAVTMGWRVYRKQGSLSNAFQHGITIWIPGALVLLLQTWMAHAVAMSRDIKIQHSLDALRVLGTALINGYWSTFQADRFFVGVGKQLEIGIALFTAASAFLVACVALFAIGRSCLPWSRPGVAEVLMRRIWNPLSALMISAVVSVVMIGSAVYRIPFGIVESVAFFLMAIVFCASYVYWALGYELEDLSHDEIEHPEYPLPSGCVRPDEVEDLRRVLAILTVLGSMLLGWPCMVIIGALWAAAWLASGNGFGWRVSAWGHLALWGLMSGGAGLLGAVFVTRSLVIAPVLVSLVVGWAMIGVATRGLAWESLSFSRPVTRRIFPYTLMFAASVAFALAVDTLVVIAIMALLLLGLYGAERRFGYQTWYAQWGMVVFGWLSVLLIWMGK